MDGVLSFIYRDARGNITFREVQDLLEDEDYIQAYCRASEGLRTFRRDRILEVIDDAEVAQQRLKYHIENSPPPLPDPVPRGPYNVRVNKDGAVEICFTGFKKVDKERLAATAEDRGLFVVTTVRKNLEFLCCGYNAGPKKIEKARNQGAFILSEKQFLALMETGELPVE